MGFSKFSCVQFFTIWTDYIVRGLLAGRPVCNDIQYVLVNMARYNLRDGVLLYVWPQLIHIQRSSRWKHVSRFARPEIRRMTLKILGFYIGSLLRLPFGSWSARPRTHVISPWVAYLKKTILQRSHPPIQHISTHSHWSTYTSGPTPINNLATSNDEASRTTVGERCRSVALLAF